MTGPTSYDLTVAQVRRETADSWVLTLRIPAPLMDVFAWTPGQHLVIVGDDEVRRSYSIVGAPASDCLSVGIKQIPGGAFSDQIVPRLQGGDVLRVMPPRGSFAAVVRDREQGADANRRSSHVAIAAGSGITPVLPILRDVLERDPSALGVLIYGNRTSASVMFVDEIADLKDRYPERLVVCHVFSGESRESELCSGRITAARVAELLSQLSVAEIDEFYLCGPQEMVEELRGPLAETGARVHFELFHAQPSGVARAVAPVLAQGSSLRLHLAGRTTLAQVAPGESVLDAGLRVRADLPFACKSGVCGTCRARVTEGSAEMLANYALEPDEVAVGYVLTCQSRPTSAALSVDYDV